ncbi:hypothetical protein [Chryseolinea sp. H1M3-3]|uniref:hypothetical protein n=1 Tax=Chryseolinea sp. H1M3-3 TaxID=3034144 RepID=UPI0023EBC13B|nr:hypothetical protein [Chryseolinea sp. H1M3-3]
MEAKRVERILTLVDEQIIRTLLYYDIFNYPLKSEEIIRFLGIPAISHSVFVSRINFLKEQKIIFQFGNFFSLKDNMAFIERRIKGNREAEKFLLLAAKKARFISRFPFVRGVLASGSLSKGYMDENSDLDFFIITAPKRLWIARTLLVLYKRLFLFNAHKYFCVNYFVDEDHLEIEEKNLFTATELATVIPLYGVNQFENLHQRNAWITDFFPNYEKRDVSNVPVSIPSIRKRLIEKCLGGWFGSYLEKYFRHKTLSRWKRLYEKDYSASDFKVAFKSKSYAAKNHDKNFQRRVMDIYQDKLKSAGLNSNGQFNWASRSNSTLVTGKLH